MGSRGTGAAGITPEERKRHAELIRDLLVQINSKYREQFGTPPPSGEREKRTIDRDVEMIAAQ